MEIQSSDLRIGNFLYFGSNNHRINVQSVTDRGINSGFDGYDSVPYDRLHGIPITPEILYKCGFVDNGQNIGLMDFDRFTIRLRSGICSVYYINVWLIDLNYLHQLQNLFYCLVGTDIKTL